MYFCKSYFSERQGIRVLKNKDSLPLGIWIARKYREGSKLDLLSPRGDKGTLLHALEGFQIIYRFGLASWSNQKLTMLMPYFSIDSSYPNAYWKRRLECLFKFKKSVNKLGLTAINIKFATWLLTLMKMLPKLDRNIFSKWWSLIMTSIKLFRNVKGSNACRHLLSSNMKD